MALTELTAWRGHIGSPGERYQVIYRSTSGCYEPAQFKYVLKARGVTLHDIQVEGGSARVELEPGRQNQLSHMIGDVMTADCGEPWIVTKVYLVTDANTGSGSESGGILGTITDAVTAPFRFAGEQVDRGFGLIQLLLVGIIVILAIVALRGDKILKAVPKVQAG